jgi:hypothetical protein
VHNLAKLGGDTTTSILLSDRQMLLLLLNSIGLGIILVIATFYEVKYLSEYAGLDTAMDDDDDDKAESAGSPESIKPKPAKKKAVSNLEIFLGAANLLFLCVGLTGIMLLVNNNLARAFAIAAALALTRFRIKLDQKSVNASLLFAILIGMACGLGEERLAWMATGIYIVLFIILFIVVRLLKPKTVA